ncbi:sulfite exporter TauE/SafE family protein [Mycolicibacterium goodii]|uniref:sulfite exporter TauE/SafE family protein n=1 Tax=Mycolicibacterium goodii TaxID=134601 RepID=UPI0027DF078D|nr:sulfite exporter TauE/SafE family protein [Mycolicibacterium goodii]
MNNIVLLLMFGVFIGLTTVFFGFGGGFVVVPVLYGLNAGHPDAMHIAVATSTAVMVVNASIATFTSRSTGLIRRDYLIPLAVFIAGGAAIGALVATRAPDSLVHALFVAYLLITIIDAVARRGFLERSGDPRPLGKAASTVGGLGIGAVAAFLGVGGSVMTVPLLRRRQVSMAAATAMANPLSIPVALVGTVMYLIPREPLDSLGVVGYVDVLACGCLLAVSLPTIALGRKLVRHVPDRIHAIAYVALLVVALVAMLTV